MFEVEGEAVYKRVSGSLIGSNRADSCSFELREIIQSELESGHRKEIPKSSKC